MVIALLMHKVNSSCRLACPVMTYKQNRGMVTENKVKRIYAQLLINVKGILKQLGSLSHAHRESSRELHEESQDESSQQY